MNNAIFWFYAVTHVKSEISEKYIIFMPALLQLLVTAGAPSSSLVICTLIM
jgi:hypothetical protein